MAKTASPVMHVPGNFTAMVCIVPTLTPGSFHADDIFVTRRSLQRPLPRCTLDGALRRLCLWQLHLPPQRLVCRRSIAKSMWSATTWPTLTRRASRQEINFEDLFYQTLHAGLAPTGKLGGTNPTQNGLGVATSAISSILSQGTLTTTGSPLDLAIQGNGFFAVSNANSTLYTRDGNFTLNGSQVLVDANGNAVQRIGTVGEGGGGLPAFQSAGSTNIIIPTTATVPGQATANVTVVGNLDAGTAVGGQAASTTIQIFDSQGNSHTLTLQFTKTASNTWSITGSVPAADGTVTQNTIAPVTFNASGLLQSPASGTLSVTFTSPNTLPAETVNINIGTVG